MGGLGDFGPALDDVAFNDDGSLKLNGKQNIKFYKKKFLAYKARWKIHEETGKKVLDIDPKTGLPFKDAYEDEVEMVRVETKGDTNIKDDVANDLDRRQHYRQYKWFRDGKIPDGNPIEDFDFLQPSTVMELHYYGKHVIQQVAAMDDMTCERLKDQSGYEVRDIAAQWVRINSPQGTNLKLDNAEKEIIELKRKLAALEAGAPQRLADGLPPPLLREGTEPVDFSTAIQSETKARGRPRKRLVE